MELGLGSLIPIPVTSIKSGNRPRESYLNAFQATGNIQKTVADLVESSSDKLLQFNHNNKDLLPVLRETIRKYPRERETGAAFVLPAHCLSLQDSTFH